MGKVILEVPGVSDIKIKTKGISEAIKKLSQLKRTKINKADDVLNGVKKFKGIAKHQDINGPEDEWYYQ